METREFFDRAKLLDRPSLLRNNPGWTDRLPRPYGRPARAHRHLVKRSWWFYVPTSIVQRYLLWLARKRYELDIEQIEVDRIDDLATTSMHDDSREALGAVEEKHNLRRLQARFNVATRERTVLERLARRWDVDCPAMIHRGEANEAAIAQVRRAIREARWTLWKRWAELLVPILSLLVALAALFARSR